MTMVKENWQVLLLPGLRKTFHMRMRSREEMFKRAVIFPVDTSLKAQESHQGIGELTTAMWNEFQKTGRVTYGSFERGFKTDLVHRRFAGGMQVERELMDDNLYPGAGIPKSITQKVEKIADSAAVHREKSAAALFNNAFTDTGVDNEGHPIAGADNVGLCSTAHPRSPSDSATQSNEGTLALTKENARATKLLMRRFTDDNGELVSINPDTLLVPPELEDDAEVLNRSALDPDSANNAVNTQAGKWKIQVWDYLLDPNAWFEIDSLLKEQHLVWYDRIAPEFDSEGDFDTLIAKYRGYYRFSRGFDAWQWIYGNNPS